MKKYSPSAWCAKCGSVRKEVTWIDARPHEIPELAKPERMVVKCVNCGHGDTFVPLDATV